MVEIAGVYINPDHIERIETWGERLLVSGAVSAKGCVIYFTSGRRWKCSYPKTQVLSIIGKR